MWTPPGTQRKFKNLNVKKGRTCTYNFICFVVDNAHLNVNFEIKLCEPSVSVMFSDVLILPISDTIPCDNMRCIEVSDCMGTPSGAFCICDLAESSEFCTVTMRETTTWGKLICFNE